MIKRSPILLGAFIARIMLDNIHLPLGYAAKYVFVFMALSITIRSPHYNHMYEIVFMFNN